MGTYKKIKQLNKLNKELDHHIWHIQDTLDYSIFPISWEDQEKAMEKLDILKQKKVRLEKQLNSLNRQHTIITGSIVAVGILLFATIISLII